MNFKMHCIVCATETTKYRASPFSPCSYALCAECDKEKRLPYEDLVLAVQSRHNYDEEFGANYIDQYVAPTLKFYNKTLENIIPDAKSLLETGYIRHRDDHPL